MVEPRLGVAISLGCQVATAHVMLHKAGDTVAAALFSCLAGAFCVEEHEDADDSNNHGDGCVW
eukprot:173553-Hanusia_phi.AAC.2